MSLAALELTVRERLGLDPSSLGESALRSAIQQRMKERAVGTSEEYSRLLTFDVAEVSALAAELAVPETWFFRGGRPLFTRIAEFVAARAATRASGQSVRVLSIPCSTGEEPYSLAIAFHEHFIPPEQYTIDAVDVSSRHLERAAAARFPAFSFREGGSDIRPAHFRQLGDRWELLPHLRQRVRFRIANLTDPAFLADEQPYDLIICRNVFIYFTPDGRRRAMTSLDRLLASDGMLCLTAGEADRLPPGQFTHAAAGEFGLYRRVQTSDVAIPRRESQAPAELWRVARPEPLTPPPTPSQWVPPPEPVVLTPTPAKPALGARELADAGRLPEARSACERDIREQPTADAYTLLGTIHLAEGHGDEAAEAFRRALYLNPDHAEAIEHMIVICDRKGNATQAAALRRRLTRKPREDAK